MKRFLLAAAMLLGGSAFAQQHAPEIHFTSVPNYPNLPEGMQTEYPVEILQTPRRFVYLFESNNIFHVVPTDGRRLSKELDPKWMGTSVGSYEGDTLVIDTRGFNGRITLDVGAEHPTSDAMHIVERLRYTDANHVAYELTIDDPKVYTRPITNVRTCMTWPRICRHLQRRSNSGSRPW